MNQNQNNRQNRQGRPGQSNKSHQNNQKRGGGKPRQHNNRAHQPNSPTKQMDSRGPAGHQRGTAVQLYEKYKLLAQDRRASDRLESESLSQHADHYYRIYAEFSAVEAAAKAVREKEIARKALEDAERRANAKPVESKPSVQAAENGQPGQNSEENNMPEKPGKSPEKSPEQKPEKSPEKKPVYVAKNGVGDAQAQPALELDLDVPKKRPVKKAIKKAPENIETEASQIPEEKIQAAPPKKRTVRARKKVIAETDADA